MPDYFIIILIFMFLVMIFEIVSMWRVYRRLGLPGISSIIPIYNFIVLYKAVNLSIGYFFLLFIPFLNIYSLYVLYTSIAHRFGKKKSFGILMLFFAGICFPILAFGKYEQTDDVDDSSNDNMNVQPIEQMEFQTEQVLKDGPITPIGAFPDQKEVSISNISSNQSSFNEMSMDSDPLSNDVSYEYNMDSTVHEQSEPIEQNDLLTAQAKGMVEEEEKEVVPDVNLYKECPTCGNKVEPNATSCFLCGTRFY